MGTFWSRQKRPKSAKPVRMCLTKGQWLHMKTTTLGLPASDEASTIPPVVASGSEKAGIFVPSETMRDGVADMSELLASRVGSPPALLAANHRGRVWEPFEGSH